MNLPAAAERHYQDGCKLLADKRFDNAGYHFGLSAECALKQKLLDYGLFTDEEAYWQHWPDLKGSASLAIQGRQAAPAQKLLIRGSFMQNWTIKMRYSQNSFISEQQAERWKDDANETLGLLL